MATKSEILTGESDFVSKRNVRGSVSALTRNRLVQLSALAVMVAVVVSLVARLLVRLIDFFTNLSFYGRFSLESVSPASNHLGFFVVVIPVIGGAIVGLMALFGSKAIRGHGIPEAMEQVLTNKSKIKPSIAILKPVSAAISIGTGGPFGAEGPIIATGSALGSTFGQLLKITNYERKILLAAGATAGMSAIFGTPLAAICLAIELLLFEFSPRSIIPIALACITGATGHYFLFDPGPVFPVSTAIATPDPEALLLYSVIGILIGLCSVLVTKSVFFVEDMFEKLPVHWVWWPAMGGIVVGVAGYFAPRTLGVGYNNIVDLLSGDLAVRVLLSLCLIKFISWTIALGSGTSGGTLAPLLTIGGAAGALIGKLAILIFPELTISISLSALVGMTAMFAGASRAVLTSILFGLETTDQTHALLPLLAACMASYFVSFYFMKNTIMTEKIARRGVKAPHSFESDVLERTTVGQVMRNARLSSAQLETGTLSDQTAFLHDDQNLRSASEMMSLLNVYELPVRSPKSNDTIGFVSYKDVIHALHNREDEEQISRSISLRKQSLRMLVRIRKLRR